MKPAFYATCKATQQSRSFKRPSLGELRDHNNCFSLGTDLKVADQNAKEAATAGFQLTRLDDLESLAYILLALLRGHLPWQPYERRRILNSTRQVLEKKCKWMSSRLGVRFAPPFGKFLDYARGLLFDETPDYKSWIVTFKLLGKTNGTMIIENLTGLLKKG
ncbi:hypothetical protein H2248_000566 [Termitomyces sp. 'cryptogamus']|nr:hypothetical protein H2248_000566 [Termitomyces sp. 'cryptogamus']